MGNQRKRQNYREKEALKTRDQTSRIIRLLAFFAFLICLFVSAIIIIAIPQKSTNNQLVEQSSEEILTFDNNSPFSISDLSPDWYQAIQKNGSLHLSDGPRGISIGDSLDKVLSVYPVQYQGPQPDDAEILYCADYFMNSNGIMTALPPRGLLSEENGRELVVVLLSPLSEYPAGTKDNYREYAHVYCKYTITPETMTVSSIMIGLTQ